MRDHYTVGTRQYTDVETRKLKQAAGDTPITTGRNLREIVEEWTLRSVQAELGDIFSNAKVLFISGAQNYRLASILAEATDNLSFADPLVQFGLPHVLHTLDALELFAAGSHPILRFGNGKALVPSLAPLQFFNHFLLKRAVREAHVVVATHYEQLRHFGSDELEGKTVITATVSEGRRAELAEKGVRLVLDCSIQLFEETVELDVVEAMVMAALHKSAKEISHDDYLEIVTDLELAPRIIYPIDGLKQINRFAFVIHPLSQQYFANLKSLELVSKVAARRDGPCRKSGRLYAAIRLQQGFGHTVARRCRGRGMVDRSGWNAEGNHVSYTGVHVSTTPGSGRYGQESRCTDHGIGRVHQSCGRRGRNRGQTSAAAHNDGQ
ncbi:MAG: hypothetical protein AAGL66_03310 [Pseudomonadota bacterium]